MADVDFIDEIYIENIKNNYKDFFNIAKKYYCHQTNTISWVNKKYGTNTLPSIVILNKYFKEEKKDLPKYLHNRLETSKKLYKKLNDYTVDNDLSIFLKSLELLSKYFSNEKNCKK